MIRIGSWRPTTATFIGGIAVLIGLLLAEFNDLFLFLTLAGAFGPGILREFGWLKDKDEFQRRAEWRAGYHAFLAGGVVTFVLVIVIRMGDRNLGDPAQIVNFILSIFWFTWLFSSSLAFWGSRRTVSTILITFGIAWLIFVIMSHRQNLLSLLKHTIWTFPFFVLSLTSRKWPRLSGFLLILASGGIFYAFKLYELFGDTPFEKGRGFVLVFFIGPLLAGGISLLVGDRNRTEEVSIADAE